MRDRVGEMRKGVVHGMVMVITTITTITTIWCKSSIIIGGIVLLEGGYKK